MRKKNTLLQLFLNMLYISAFTFGGGFVIITLMKRKFCDEMGWLEEKEMLDITALAQSSPGAIAVNAAILVGWKLAGAAGMAVAVTGTIIPPIAILSAISYIYEAFASNVYVGYVLKGMQTGVVAVLFDVVYTMGAGVVKAKSWLNYGLMAAAFLATAVWKINVVYIILAAVAVGILSRGYAKWREGKPWAGAGQGARKGSRAPWHAVRRLPG